ncbi:RNA-binding S4 domain-containing protein, partial [Campylobacter lari]
VVSINNQVVKASKDVKIGDEISIKFIEHTDTYKVLDIPTTKSIPKAMQEKYVVKIK